MELRLRRRGNGFLKFFEMQWLLTYYPGGRRNLKEDVEDLEDGRMIDE